MTRQQFVVQHRSGFAGASAIHSGAGTGAADSLAGERAQASAANLPPPALLELNTQQQREVADLLSDRPPVPEPLLLANTRQAERGSPAQFNAFMARCAGQRRQA